MKRRNPPRTRGRLRLPQLRAGDPRTSARALYDFALTSPLTGEPKIKLLRAAARALAAEARARLLSH